jgi:hypothetical protein
MRASILIVLVMASVAAAQDLSGMKLGDQLYLDPRFPKPKGHQDYAVEGKPDLAITLLGPEHPTETELADELAQLRQRQSDLDRLAKAGVPALRVLEIGVVDGRPAYLHRRMETGTGEPNWMTSRGDYLGEATKTSADEIAAKLRASGIGVKEAEIYVDSKGRLFVDAPKGIVTEGPWADFYARQTIGRLDSIKGNADLSIAYRKTKLLADMPGAKDHGLARWFEHGMVDILDGDMRAESELKAGLAAYLAKGPTTELAKQAGQDLAKGKLGLFVEHVNELFKPKPTDLVVKNGRSFPELAFDAVRSAAFSALAGVSDFERGVLADARALEFWRAKSTPDKIATDGPAKKASTYAHDPSALVKDAEARSGTKLTDSERSDLVAKAKAILGTPSRSEGLSGALSVGVDGTSDAER